MSQTCDAELDNIFNIVLFDLFVSWSLSSSSLAGLKTARSSPTLLCCHIALNQTISRCSYEEDSCFWVSDLFPLPLNLVKFPVVLLRCRAVVTFRYLHDISRLYRTATYVTLYFIFCKEQMKFLSSIPEYR